HTSQLAIAVWPLCVIPHIRNRLSPIDNVKSDWEKGLKIND
ncbi:hypothetical protein SAMN04488513_1311, partial [Pseudozobellia thermophila]